MTFYLCISVTTSQKELGEPIKSVITCEVEKLYKGKDAKTINEEFIASNSKSLEHLLAGTHSMTTLKKAPCLLLFTIHLTTNILTTRFIKVISFFTIPQFVICSKFCKHKFIEEIIFNNFVYQWMYVQK